MVMNYDGEGYYAICDDDGFAIDIKWFDSRESATKYSNGKCYFWDTNYEEVQ